MGVIKTKSVILGLSNGHLGNASSGNGNNHKTNMWVEGRQNPEVQLGMARVWKACETIKQKSQVRVWFRSIFQVRAEAAQKLPLQKN